MASVYLRKSSFTPTNYEQFQVGRDTYQCVQVLRTQLKKAGINDSWATLRKTLSVQRRLTTRLRRKDGRTIHVRKSTVAEPALMAIYQALAINPAPGGTKKLICKRPPYEQTRA